MLRFEPNFDYVEAIDEDGNLIARFWDDGHVSFVHTTNAGQMRQILAELNRQGEKSE